MTPPTEIYERGPRPSPDCSRWLLPKPRRMDEPRRRPGEGGCVWGGVSRGSSLAPSLPCLPRVVILRPMERMLSLSHSPPHPGVLFRPRQRAFVPHWLAVESFQLLKSELGCVAYGWERAALFPWVPPPGQEHSSAWPFLPSWPPRGECSEGESVRDPALGIIVHPFKGAMSFKASPVAFQFPTLERAATCSFPTPRCALERMQEP